MIKNKVYDLLLESKNSKYWLYKQLGTSWRNMNKILLNETKSISYEFIDVLTDIFKCLPGDLFEKIKD